MIGRRGFITGRQAIGALMFGLPIFLVLGGVIYVAGWVGVFAIGFSIAMTASSFVGMEMLDL